MLWQSELDVLNLTQLYQTSEMGNRWQRFLHVRLWSPKEWKSSSDTWILALSGPLHITYTHNSLKIFSSSRFLQWDSRFFLSDSPSCSGNSPRKHHLHSLLSFCISTMLQLIMLMHYHIQTLTWKDRLWITEPILLLPTLWVVSDIF